MRRAYVCIGVVCACTPFGAAEESSPRDAGALDGARSGIVTGDAGNVAQQGLGIYLPFDEGSGTKSRSKISPHEAVLVDAGWTEGQTGKALLLDGVSSYATVEAVPPLPITELTFAAWVKLGQTTDDQRIAMRRRSWEVKLNGRHPQLIVFLDQAVFVMSARSIPLDEWHHIAMTYDRGSARIYVDGTLTTPQQGTLDSGAPLPAAPDERILLGVNVDFTPGEFARGAIDEVRIYNRALSDLEVSGIAK
jgi:hypothetical protein